MIGKILTRLFALFGMTLTCVACYGTMYEEYNPDFAASGRVVDPENNPIENIEVRMGSLFVTHTDQDGHFYIHGEVSELTFTDVDGQDNGGEFESRSLRVDGGVHDVGDVVLTRINK